MDASINLYEEDVRLDLESETMS
ncbi:hypothetical protein N9414_22433 [Nodularia spumigena CCY9414]|nr:hypothetical protein N9414_22433 [Nodularia spumigena CCY9414]